MIKNLNNETLNHISSKQSIDRRKDGLKSSHGEPIPNINSSSSNIFVSNNRSGISSKNEYQNTQNFLSKSPSKNRDPIEEDKEYEHNKPKATNTKPAKNKTKT